MGGSPTIFTHGFSVSISSRVVSGILGDVGWVSTRVPRRGGGHRCVVLTIFYCLFITSRGGFRDFRVGHRRHKTFLLRYPNGRLYIHKGHTRFGTTYHNTCIFIDHGTFCHEHKTFTSHFISCWGINWVGRVVVGLQVGHSTYFTTFFF